MSPTPLLLRQRIVVLVAARACGWVANRLGQPGTPAMPMVPGASAGGEVARS